MRAGRPGGSGGLGDLGGVLEGGSGCGRRAADAGLVCAMVCPLLSFHAKQNPAVRSIQMPCGQLAVPRAAETALRMAVCKVLNNVNTRMRGPTKRAPSAATIVAREYPGLAGLLLEHPKGPQPNTPPQVSIGRAQRPQTRAHPATNGALEVPNLRIPPYAGVRFFAKWGSSSLV